MEKITGLLAISLIFNFQINNAIAEGEYELYYWEGSPGIYPSPDSGCASSVSMKSFATGLDWVLEETIVSGGEVPNAQCRMYRIIDDGSASPL